MKARLTTLRKERERKAAALADVNQRLHLAVREAAESMSKTDIAQTTGLSRQTIHSILKGDS